VLTACERQRGWLAALPQPNSPQVNILRRLSVSAVSSTECLAGKETFMLVLSRKEGEKIIVGDTIKVTVLEIRGNKVRLGFDAPDDVQIYRDEVAQKIRLEEIEKHLQPKSR
jgi:carbon storage regulator